MAIDKPAPSGQFLVHQIKRRLATGDPPRFKLIAALAQILHLEAANRDIGFVTVLLPEEPLIDLRLKIGIVG